VQRLLRGEPLRPPGRPRSVKPAQVQRLRRRLERSERERERMRAAVQERQRQEAASRERQMLGLIFHGASLRGAAECLELGWGAGAPGKSTIGERLAEYSASARELFEEYFAGRGQAGACDEIYLSGHPCLEVVDPRSLAITGLRPDTPPTQKAWEALLADFENLEAGVSDQGLGVSQALATKLRGPALDEWHLLRHLAAGVGRLEARAYDWIAEEERRRLAFLQALPCPPGTLPPELDRLEQAQQRTAQTVARYDAAHTVVGWLYEATDTVDAQGRVRTPQQIRQDWETALDLINGLDVKELYPLADRLRDKMDGLFAEDLPQRLQALPLPGGWTQTEREGLQQRTCQAWREHHRRQTHLTEAPRRAARTVAADYALPSLAGRLEPYVGAVFALLDSVLTSSSAVECVNSVVRLRQGSKRHPLPDFVFLLAWLHNTRTFREGRRRGLSPAQILGVSLPGDGWQMLVEHHARRAHAVSPEPAATQAA